MDRPKPDVKSRVKLFENGPASSLPVDDTTHRVTNSNGVQQQGNVAPRRGINSPKEQKAVSIGIPTRSDSGARTQNSSPPVVLSPTKKVLTMNGTVSKRYYDIKARRNILRGKSNVGTARKESFSAEERSSGESSGPMPTTAQMKTKESGVDTQDPPDKSPVSPTHRVWSESQQQDERHQLLERRVGVEDGGVGWFSPPEEETSLSSSDHASLAKPHSGPASYSPDLREPMTRSSAKYESKVARLRNIRSRSPYFIAHHDKELKRNLEAASVILNEEKESSVGSGESSSTRSSLSKEEIKKVAERALELSKGQKDSSTRATIVKNSPLHQMLSEKRPRKATVQPRKATISYNPGPPLSKMYAVSRHGRLQASVSSTTSNSETTPSGTSASGEVERFPGRLTRSERYAMIKAKSSHPYKRGAGPGGASVSDEDSMDVSGTTDDSAVPYQARQFKDSPMFGYSQHFLAMTRQTENGRSYSPYDDSSTITSESPQVTGSESQTISSADEKQLSGPFYKGNGNIRPGARYSRSALPPPFSVPIRSPSSRPTAPNSHQSTISTSTGDNTESIGGSDSTNRAMNRSFTSRSQRAKALKEALQRQEKPLKRNQGGPKEGISGTPDSVVDSPTKETSPKRSPKVRSSRDHQRSNGEYDAAKEGFRESRNDNEFFDRLCKPDMIPVKTSESETDSGDDAFFKSTSRHNNQHETTSSSYGTSTSSSADVRPLRSESKGSRDVLPAVDTTSVSTTLDGVGLLDMESSVENSSSKFSLRKQPGPFQRSSGTPPPPPPPPVSSYYFDRKKDDDSYDTSDEIEQTRSPTEHGPSPAKSSMTQASNNDAIKWWNKNYSQLVEKSDQAGSTSNEYTKAPRRGIDPVQVQTSSYKNPIMDDDEDVFSGLEEDRKDERTVSSDESDGIPTPRETPKREASSGAVDKSRSPMKLVPLQPLLSQRSPEPTSPASPRSPLSPRSNLQGVASPRSSVQSGRATTTQGTSTQHALSFSSPVSRTKAATSWPHKLVDTIEEEGTQGGESREKSMDHGALEMDDLLDDSVMVASMSISKAIGKDGQPQQSQQSDHIALLNFGYSIFESISSFCKLPKRPLLEANACVEKSQHSCREVEEGSSVAHSFIVADGGKSYTSGYVMRNADALKDQTLRERDPEVWAMLEARERAHRMRSTGHGDFEATLAVQDSDKSCEDFVDQAPEEYEERRRDAQQELFEVGKQAISLYGGIAKGKVSTNDTTSALRPISLSKIGSNDRQKSAKNEIDCSTKSSVGSFFAVMKNEGMEVLKLGRRNKWQLRYLTVTVEVMHFADHKSEDATGDAPCPLGLLWLKHRPDSQHGLSSLKKLGRGGLPFSSLRKIESVKDENAGDATGSLSKVSRKLRTLFPSLNGVSIEYSYISDDGSLENRSVLFCFKTENDAAAFAAAMETIKSIVSRVPEASRGLDP